tara:strand:+ start:1391 stop:2308 length:918 start_codon:yes stop_codon:yes gene_type:complete
VELFGQIWGTVIVQPMINSLVFLYTVAFSNFGIAIAIFTIAVRGVMMPLTVKQSRQMKAMSALQPKIKEIQARYSNDKQRQSQETMKLYREQGVNPIGCLGPMFIQMPIWIGLYQAIIQTVKTVPESLVGLSENLYPWLPMINDVVPLDASFLWLDLGVKDPYPILPILVGVSMFLMQKMTMMPAADDKQASTNKMMLWMMPLMFGFFSTQFPSGLSLYWVISNFVGIVIQGFITGWEPLANLVNFRRGVVPEPTVSLSGATGSVVEESEQYELHTDDGENSGRRDRDRPKRTRRRPRRGRNRRR